MNKFAVLFFLFSLISCAQKEAKNDYIDSIKEYQYEMNKRFSDKKTTPFNEKDFVNFRSLSFFDIDEAYKIKADFKLDENPELFEMPTTTDRKPLYTTYGTAYFTINDQELELHIYQCKDKDSPDFYDSLFLPFTDATSGQESYGGGRYIEPEYPKDGIMIIDFNLSYNPYCVYNAEKYSCPIPPEENRLPIAIKAGIKNYKISGY